MPSTTFLNLNEAKRAKVTQALLTEFSQHSVADAQVARIVKTAGIARGAFYKYFDDLQDAYTYLYHQAMIDLHQKISKSGHLLSADEYREQVQDFLSVVKKSPYRDLVKLHFQINENAVKGRESSIAQPTSGREWGVMVLSHEVIKEVLEKPEKEEQLMDYYYSAVKALTAKEGD